MNTNPLTTLRKSAQVKSAIENSTIANDWVRTGRVDASVLLEGGVANLDPVPSRISAGTVDLTGGYRGNVSRVDLVVDGSVAATDPNPAAGRFGLTWDASAAQPGDYVLQVEAGITTGTTPTTFGPDQAVTRAQLATFLWRYAGNPNPESGQAA